MNQAELLDQFVIEARECLESIGKRLLDVEREPQNSTLLNDLFRSVHTLKGNCGLFEFKPLERVVHAGEDLLDRVRNHTLAYSAELADALLDAMDYSARLVDQIEQGGRFDENAEHQSMAHAQALRALLGASADSAATPSAEPVASPAAAAALPVSPASPASVVAEPPPVWLSRLDPDLFTAHPEATAWHYTPEEGCFFKGEDPWRLACTTPGLLAVDVVGQQPWPQGDALVQWDCYQCNLDFVLLSSAPRAEVEAHFRCMPEQVQGPARPVAAVAVPVAAAAVRASGAPSDAERRVRQRALALRNDQHTVLARAAASPAAAAVARQVLERLNPWLDSAATDAGAAGVVTESGPDSPAGSGSSDAGVGDIGRRAEEATGAQAQKVLKVGQEKVDRLMDLIGEMVVAKNSLPYLAQRAETVFGQRELAREIKAQYTVINRIAEDMQHAIMQVRMLPVGAVFQRFGRLVRDISRKLGKEVQLVIEGEETEADKNVIEPLADPLIHILRNSLDHGIETPEVRRAAGKPIAGTIRIQARQESDRVIIEISDDGAGVNAARVRAKAVERGLIPADRAASLSDHDAVQLIFLPGFSTAEAISDLSGRGVGMDVVRTAVERINGGVELSSVQGKGTTIRLSLPLSMAVTNVMVVESAGRRFGVPMDLIVETVRVHGDDIHSFKQARTTVLRGRIVPLRALNDLLALDTAPRLNAEGELAVLVVRIGTEPVGLLVDQFNGASDIILKPLEGVLAGLTGFAGTALMGDGGVLMVLNPKELLT